MIPSGAGSMPDSVRFEKKSAPEHREKRRGQHRGTKCAGNQQAATTCGISESMNVSEDIHEARGEHGETSEAQPRRPDEQAVASIEWQLIDSGLRLDGRCSDRWSHRHGDNTPQSQCSQYHVNPCAQTIELRMLPHKQRSSQHACKAHGETGRVILPTRCGTRQCRSPAIRFLRCVLTECAQHHA
jgi:hypothetical protein